MVLDDEDVKKLVDVALQASPPTVVSCTTLLGIPLSEWVYLVTILYTIVGVITIIKKHWVDPYLRAKKRLRDIERRLKEEYERKPKDKATEKL